MILAGYRRQRSTAVRYHLVGDPNAPQGQEAIKYAMTFRPITKAAFSAEAASRELTKNDFAHFG